MSRLSCSFCSHLNPERSKFCNECGSPLNLVPCSHCEAINNVSDSQCSRCGAQLYPAAAAELTEPEQATRSWHADDDADTAPVEAQGRAAAISSIPISLADRLESSTWAPSARPHDAPAAVEPYVPASSSYAAQETPAAEDPPPPYRGMAREYGERRGYRMHAVVLTVLLVAVAATIYWSSIDWPPMQGPLASDRAPPAAQSAAASAMPEQGPKPPVRTTDTTPPSEVSGTGSPATAAPAAMRAPASMSDSAAPPATGPSTPPSPSAPAAGEEAKSPEVDSAVSSDALPAPATTEAARAARPATRGARSASAKASARAATDASRHETPHVRTKEEAERDAIATQRLIARDLGTVARPDSSTRTMPGS